MKLLHRSDILRARAAAAAGGGSSLELEHLLDLRLDGRASLVEALLPLQLPELLDLTIPAAQDVGPGRERSQFLSLRLFVINLPYRI